MQVDKDGPSPDDWRHKNRFGAFWRRDSLSFPKDDAQRVTLAISQRPDPPKRPDADLEAIAECEGEERLGRGRKLLESEADGHPPWTVELVLGKREKSRAARQWRAAKRRHDELQRRLANVPECRSVRIGRADWRREGAWPTRFWRFATGAVLVNEVYALTNFAVGTRLGWLKDELTAAPPAVAVVGLVFVATNLALQRASGKAREALRDRAVQTGLVWGLAMMLAFAGSVGSAYDSVGTLGKGELPSLPIPSWVLLPLICVGSALFAVQCELKREAAYERLFEHRDMPCPEHARLKKAADRASADVSRHEKAYLAASELLSQVASAKRLYVERGVVWLKHFCVQCDQRRSDAKRREESAHDLTARREDEIKARARREIAEIRDAAIDAE